jgi:hypothetical protein
MEKSVMPRDQAEQEVNEWLDFKRVNAAKRESSKDDIKNIVDAVEAGHLVLNSEDRTFKYTLLFPIGEVKEFTIQPRVNAGKVQAAMFGVKTDDLYGMFSAYISALTTVQKEVLKKLDSEDYNLLRRIAGFFM